MTPRRKLLVPFLFCAAAFAGKQVYDKRRKGEQLDQNMPCVVALRANILTAVSDKEHRKLLSGWYLQLLVENSEDSSKYLNVLQTIRKQSVRRSFQGYPEQEQWVRVVLQQHIGNQLTFLARSRVGEQETQQTACKALSVILAKSAVSNYSQIEVKNRLRMALANEPMLVPELCLLRNVDPRLLEEASIAVYESSESLWRQDLQDEHHVNVALRELLMTTLQRKVEQSSSSSSHMDDYGFTSPAVEWDPFTDPSLVAKSRRAILRIINKAVVQDSACIGRVLEAGGLEILKTLADILYTELSDAYKARENTDVIFTEVARLVANLVMLKEGRQRAIVLQWPQILVDWLNSQDIYEKNSNLSLEIHRAIANLQPGSKSKYPDGIFLIYPTYKQPLEPELDVILVHGLLGGPLRTWRTWDRQTSRIVEPDYFASEQNESDEERVTELENNALPRNDMKTLTVWPRDWLPNELPNIRVISVSYGTSISAWRSHGLPLKHQATDLLDKLCFVGIGNKPCVFIAHSYGGLVIKEALVVAANSSNEKYRQLACAVQGIVFFSTPHLGSPIVGYLKRAIVGSTFRPSVAVYEMYPGSEMLLDLNEKFKQVVKTGDIHTSFDDEKGEENKQSKAMKWNKKALEILSIGETQPTRLTQWSTQYITSVLVPPETANPGIGRFIPVEDADHLTVCKPSSLEDIRYREVAQLLHRVMKNISSSTSAE
eukprot:jgi/Galph1/5863/GphlegSOOS_G4475.1